jgi:putative DNA primase/helicase
MKALAQMVSGFGQFHTNEADPADPTKKLTPYTSIDLAGIRALVDNPQEVAKSMAQWVIPSTLPTRQFKRQEVDGQYWMLWADFDEDPKPISEVSFALSFLILGFSSNYEIYTSRSATVDRPKCRVLVPLGTPLCGADWVLCQEILNDEFVDNLLNPDRISERAAQLCYLPNRGEYYEALHQRNEVMFDPLSDWAEKIEVKRQQVKDQAAALEAANKASEERRKAFQSARVAGGIRSLIDAFNEAYCVQEILVQAGYAQRGDKFCRPGSESGSFAASVKNGRVHTMSSADLLYTGGGGGGAHDAFSAFCVLLHAGISQAAMKDAGDNWLQIGAESWNKVAQREYMRKKATEDARADATSGPNINPDTGDIESDDNLPFGSEQALADVFAIVVADRLKWSPGMDWMANNGNHWKRDELLIRYSYSTSVCKNAASGLDDPKLARKICAASTNNAVLTLARSTPGIATPVTAWDSYPMLLNTPGGVIDLETGLEVNRDGLLFTQVTGIAPNSMPTPTWDRFVSEILGGDQEMVEFVQRMGGYGLTGSIKEQKMFFFHGTGANGKSVLLDVLRNLGGTYSHNLPSEALMTSRNEGHPTMFAALHGKRLAISSEIEESAHWAESRIKSLTGDESLTARYMRQDFFTFNISHKHLIAGNFKPRLKGDDFAMVRRMVLVPFSQRFEGANRDNNLPDKLKLEYPGILMWFVEGARKWASSGLAIPSAVTEASKEYMAEQNDLELWIAECCKQGPGIVGKCNELYQSFSHWKQKNGEHAPSVKSFSQRLERTHTKVKNRDGMVFQGVRVDDMFTDLGSNPYANASRGY